MRTKIKLKISMFITDSQMFRMIFFSKNISVPIISVFLYLLSGCGNKIEENIPENELFSVKGFSPLTNWHIDTAGNKTHNPEDDRLIYIDYDNAIDGIIIPSPAQADEKGFELEFFVKNNGSKPTSFYYKLYYQNESYKFPEADIEKKGRQHPYAHENFYGSWEDSTITFISTGEIPADGDYHKISGNFRINGNPRNEIRYYENGINNRWKRNPRLGEYSFMLVVTTKDNLDKGIIPSYVSNPALTKDFIFVNPYYFFLDGDGKTLPGTIVNIAPSRLKVIAKPDPGKGIYISPQNFPADRHHHSFTATCGQSDEIYKNSPFQEFIHYVDASTKMYNIPLIADINGGEYSITDYNWSKRFYKKEELIGCTPTTAPEPCINIYSDSKNSKIVIKNPSSEYGKWQKQNTGVITRHGFTYGKYTIKCKLSELLNEHGMWNGLTNAIWLISQSGSEWNYRRDCRKEGYMATYWGGREDKRVKNVGYSEIDFEILKTVPYCPSYQFPPAFPYGISDNKNIQSWNIIQTDELLKHKGDITVACTNWDMACWEPENFGVGCQPIAYQGKIYESHRWDHWYRALTQKTWASDDNLFGGQYYYFQIDWRPEEIIWRIGPERDKLKVVGYMNKTITSIPDNQMLLIVTQEFHNTKWWPGTPFSQDNIPFPAKDLIGEIYEITIE